MVYKLQLKGVPDSTFEIEADSITVDENYWYFYQGDTVVAQFLVFDVQGWWSALAEPAKQEPVQQSFKYGDTVYIPVSSDGTTGTIGNIEKATNYFWTSTSSTA